MIKNLVLLNLIVLTLFSCKKDKEEAPQITPPIESSETFEFFKVGNRWEYFKFQIYQDGDTTHQTTDTTYFTGEVEGEENTLYLHYHRSTSTNYSTFIQKVEDGVFSQYDKQVFLPRGIENPDLTYQEIIPNIGDTLIVTIINTDTTYQDFDLNIKCYTIHYFPIRENYKKNNWVEQYFLVNNKIGLISHTMVGHNIVVEGDKLVVTRNLMKYRFVE